MILEVGTLSFDALVDGRSDGEAVLLLHGFPQSSHSWRFVIPALLEAGYRVIAPDQRGYSAGARPEEPDAYRLPALTGDALGILDTLGIAKAHVVGHDWGAAVAWQLGARHPERVRSLTTVSVPHPQAFLAALASDPDQRQRSLYMRDFARPGHDQQLLADDATDLRRFFDGAGDQVDIDDVLGRAREQGALAAWLRWYADQRREDIVDTPEVTVPTLYVWSDEDLALGEAAARGTAAWVSGAYRFEVLAGVSHWIPEQAAEPLTQLLLEHLRAR